jgi:hypothetical protein
MRYPLTGNSRRLLSGALRLAVFACATQAPCAQSHPDFSGRWVLESPARPEADMARALTVRQPVVRANVYGEPIPPMFADIAIDREVAGGVRSETHRLSTVGGTVPGIAADGRANGPWRHDSVLWQDGELVFASETSSTHTPRTGFWDERREAWSLDPDGRLHVIITTQGSDAEPRRLTLVYRRDP